MQKNKAIISKIACLVGLTIFVWGCDNKAEAPQQVQVVSKKITMAKTQKTVPAKKEAATKAPVSQAAKPPTPAAKPASKAATAAPVDSTAATPETTGKPVITQSYLLTGFYNPAGKIDPFAPLYKEKPAVKEDKQKVKKKQRMPLTPLEKVDISQLKLVGIICAPSGNTALVQEATGKGYIVKKGTYIGIHAGRVIDILKDRLIVEEEAETALGTYQLQKREIKIQKPPGEL